MKKAMPQTKLIQLAGTAFLAVLFVILAMGDSLRGGEAYSPAAYEISRILDGEIRAAEERADAFALAGGDEAAIPAAVEYEIVCETDFAVSFVIRRNMPESSDFGRVSYYNVDPATGRHLTLEDIFGEDFRRIVWEAVRKYLSEREDIYPGIDPEPMINRDRMFYITDGGDAVVVVFDTGEISGEAVHVRIGLGGEE